MPHKFSYRVQEDGKYVRVQESESEPQEDTDILNEFAGLMRREKDLLKELEECRERHAALLPTVTAIRDNHRVKAEKAAKDGEKTSAAAEEVGLGVEDVDAMRDQALREKTAAARDSEET